MGTKLAFSGLAFLLAVPKLIAFPAVEIVGAVLLVAGAVLIVLDK